MSQTQNQREEKYNLWIYKWSIYKYTREEQHVCICNITVNINGDIIISDALKQTVIFVNKLGKFSVYYDDCDLFFPTGICTEALGHILVWDTKTDTMHLFAQDWEFLGTFDFGRSRSLMFSLCVDAENNLYMGHDTNKITVYKCLQ